ncbi:MAG: AAA family ATPase [candidate division NC10 bacterium]
MSRSLAVCRAAELAASSPERRWLIDELWADQAVGIVGGEPKCCKSFLALELAVAVASGAPCLRRFRPAQTGRVLLFAAEDALPVVRRRLEGIARAAGVAFDPLDIHVITTPVVRLDLEDDRQRLQATVAALRPTLLILDPFVRLHRIDENAVAEVAPLLAYLRQLQRDFATAVLLVHHARKGAAHLRAGQALRGSSELHAWGDSNLYLRRRGDALLLTVEHRAAPSLDGLALELRAHGDALALHVVDSALDQSPAAAPSATEQIEHALATAALPLSLRQLRRLCRMRMATLCVALTTLRTNGRVLKSSAGYRLALR